MAQDPKTRYVGHTLEMLESPAWAALPDNARRILDRLEVEHMKHRGRQNGQLIQTYDQLEAAGLRRSSLREAIEITIALGFVVITRRGFKSIPSLYRLTYAKSFEDKPPVTDEWNVLNTGADADRVVRQALTDLAVEREARTTRRKNRALPGGKPTRRDVA